MRELRIILPGIQNLGDKVILVDDKPAQFKKNEYGGLVCDYQTEHSKVNIKVVRMLDIGGALWFITQIFFFLISIFGIFDIHRKERCMVIDFEAEVDLKEQSVVALKFNIPRLDGIAVEIQSDLEVQEISNEYCIDTAAKKKLKALKLTKILLTVVIIAIAIAVLMTSL